MSMSSRARSAKIKVILDSNAFFVPLHFHMDLLESLRSLLKMNFETILLSPVKLELEALAKSRSPSISRDALFALKLSETCTFLKVENEVRSADDAIVEVAKERKYAVFTNDALLRKRLRNINVPVIYVRQKSRLDIEGRLRPLV